MTDRCPLCYHKLWDCRCPGKTPTMPPQPIAPFKIPPLVKLRSGRFIRLDHIIHAKPIAPFADGRPRFGVGLTHDYLEFEGEDATDVLELLDQVAGLVARPPADALVVPEDKKVLLPN